MGFRRCPFSLALWAHLSLCVSFLCRFESKPRHTSIFWRINANDTDSTPASSDIDSIHDNGVADIDTFRVDALISNTVA